MYKKELGQRAVRIWKKVVVFMLLADRLLWSKGTGGVLQCLKALWPEYMKPVVTDGVKHLAWPTSPAASLASYLLMLVACLGGFMLRTVSGSVLELAPKGRVQMGVLPWRNAYQIFRVCISSLFDSSRSIGKVSRARSKWCLCCCCLCWDILGAETFSALSPMLVLVAPLWGPTDSGTGNTWEDGTSHVTCANTRHQEE